MLSESIYNIVVDEEGMLVLGSKLANLCGNGAIIFLHGQLGAGKTTLARGFLRGLGYTGKVKSPTYTIVEPYQLDIRTIYHFDLYRIHDPLELDFMGIQDYFGSHSLCLIEWPEYGAGMLPKPDIECFIDIQSDERAIKLIGYTSIGKNIIERIRHA